MTILDRYVLKSFLLPFLYCFLGFLAVWLVFDLSDNGPDFIEGHVPLPAIVGFYLTQLPDIAVLSLPAGLMLALLYSLGKMSRSNEIISMLTAGLSLPRILFPLLVVGVLAALASTALNYRLAPEAQASKQKQLDTFLKGRAKEEALKAHVFRNRPAHRVWFAEELYLGRGELEDVQIIQQDAAGNALFKYYVRTASYLPDEKAWRFDKGMITHFDAEGNVLTSEFLRGDNVIRDWDETPWRIASSAMVPEYLSVPELRAYLRHNADFPAAQLAPFRTYLHYRLALPWACLVVVFIAAPLGIVFSRRGVLSSVASSIFLFFGMIFLTNLFLALGSGHRIPAFWAGWTPNLCFLACGILLLWMRTTSREPADLHPRNLFRRRPARP